MAKNYSITEMVNVLVEGNDLEAIAEMGKRFPVLTYKITKVTSKAAEEFADLAKYLDFVSANRVTKLIKGDSVDEDEAVVESEVDAEDETEEEPEKRELTKAEKAKARREARKAKKAKEAAEAAEADESEDEADDGNIYSDMTAIELFKECKKRKIKAAVPKKPQAFYIDLLKKDDAKKAKEAAEAAEADESEDEDEWDAEEEPEKPVAKKARRPKATVKKAKAPAPEVEAEDDDDEDDDWDI